MGSRVSERPVFVKINVDEDEPAYSINCGLLAATGISCDAIKVTWTPPSPAPTYYQVYYYEKNDSEQSGNPTFNIARWLMVFLKSQAKVVHRL